MTCKARQYSDQMQCGLCGLQWDVNDPDRPQCLPQQVKVVKAPAVGPTESLRPHGRAPHDVGNKYMRKIREILGDD